MFRIKVTFHTENYGVITNNKPFIENFDKDEDAGGCIINFDKIPMLQDYNSLINKIWCEQLQWSYPNVKMGYITTELLDSV